MFKRIHPLTCSKRQLNANDGNRELNLREAARKCAGISSGFVEARIFGRDSFADGDLVFQNACELIAPGRIRAADHLARGRFSGFSCFSKSSADFFSHLHLHCTYDETCSAA
jgi:hypothetical protein